MKNSIAVLLGLGSILGSSLANAGSASGIVVPFDRDIIESGKLPVQTERETSVDFGFSSWAPSQITLPSQIGRGTVFERKLPAIYLNYAFQVFTQYRDVQAKVGLNWLSMTRSAAIDLGGNDKTSTQNMQLFSLRVGLEYSPSFVKTKTFEPYLGISFLPSVAMTGESNFERGSTYLGLPGELALGTRIQLSSVGLPWESAALDLGVLGTVGRLQDSSLNGIGATAGVKVGL